MATPPTNGRNGGLLATLLSKVLSFVDRPWKALFVIFAVLVGGFAFAAWEERQLLVKALTQITSHKKLVVDLAPTISHLFDDTSADAIAVWQVDLGSNTASLVRARRRDGTNWALGPSHLQWVTEQTDPVVAAHMFRGEPACNDPARLHGVLAQALLKGNIEYACYIPEPPSPTEPTIGVVILAWTKQPEQGWERAALAAVLAHTDDLVAR